MRPLSTGAKFSYRRISYVMTPEVNSVTLQIDIWTTVSQRVERKHAVCFEDPNSDERKKEATSAELAHEMKPALTLHYEQTDQQ